MPYSSANDRCWCGVMLGTAGHPEPHQPSTSGRQAGGQSAATGATACDCPCHGAAITVYIHVGGELCCPEAKPAPTGNGKGDTRPGGKGDPRGKIPDPPRGGSHNPWDIIEVILKSCRGDTPPPRKDSYLPYLVVRANPADRGQRPLPNGTCFWESPDIFVMPNRAVAGAPEVPASLGGMAQAGVPNTIFAHVWNLGRAAAFDVRVEFYWFNPTLGIEESDANLIGFTYVTLGNRNSIKSHAIVRCPVDWVPTFVNDGHECLVVRAYSPFTDPLGPQGFHAPANRHVAQRNIAVLRGAQAEALVLNVAPGHSSHAAQIITVDLLPSQVPWMQLLTGRRDPGLQTPAVAPLVGLLPPTVALATNSPRLRVAGLSNEALAQLIAPGHSFTRAGDPLQVALVTSAPRMAAGEAHVVRVQQLHEDTLVGGYTTILLP